MSVTVQYLNILTYFIHHYFNKSNFLLMCFILNWIQGFQIVYLFIFKFVFNPNNWTLWGIKEVRDGAFCPAWQNWTEPNVHPESRIFVHTDIRSLAIFDRAGRSCTYQMTAPDIEIIKVLNTSCERTSGVTIVLVNEHPGWSNKRCMNVWVVIWLVYVCPGWSLDMCTNIRPCQKSRVNKCPCARISIHRPLL